MRLYSSLVQVVCGVWLVSATVSAAQEVVPGELVVEAGVQELSTDVGVASVQSLGADYSLLKFDSIFNDAPSAEAHCALLVKSGKAISCSPNYILRASVVPNDSKIANLYGMSLIDAPRAWSVSTGSSSVVVAVIDTGIDYSHPDLASNVWTNPNEVVNGIDDDANGFVDDVHGISAINGSGDPIDENGHGTHVAGTIGGVGDNARGVAGVAWNVKIMALKFLDKRGSGTLASAIQAINYMVMMKQRGVSIVASNNSWGGGSYSEPLKHAIESARDVGILFVAAAGNEANDNDANPSYPASYEVENVLSVAAVDRNVQVASFSNIGARSVHLAAPGVDIESTYPGGTYRSLSGTSMAAPHVTGAIALMAGYDPSLSWSDLRSQVLLSGADTASLLGVVSTGRLLNVGRLLNREFLPVPDASAPSNCSYSITPVAYTPPANSDQGEVVVRGDEMGYYTFTLPFTFPFYGRDITTATISPNGVLYLGRAPSGMDFVTSDTAPRESIAALHTDLVADTAQQGVRLLSVADRVSIVWKMRPFGVSEGYAEVFLILYPDGTIDDFIHFSSNEVERAVQLKSVIGARGSGSGDADTFARSSNAIADTLGLRFHGGCEKDPAGTPRVDAIQLDETTVRGARTNAVGLNAVFWGEGTGAVSYRFMVNQRLCADVGTVTLDNGRSDLAVTLSLSPKRLRSFGIVSGKASARVYLKQANRTRNWVRNGPFSRLCRSAIRLARQR